MNAELQLIDLFIATGDQLDSLWQFFVTVHLALIASLYGIERLNHLKNIEVILFSLAYLVFSLINVRAKHDSYNLLISLENIITKVTLSGKYTELQDYFNDLVYSDRLIILWGVHFFSAIAIYAILRTRKNHENLENNIHTKP